MPNSEAESTHEAAQCLLIGNSPRGATAQEHPVSLIASLERGETGSQTSFEGSGGQSQRTASRAAHGQERRAFVLPLPSAPATHDPKIQPFFGPSPTAQQVLL